MYDVFICYKRDSAKDLAIMLKEALKDFEISAFVDLMDIPKEFEFTDKWWQARDEAICNCGKIVMIVTAGFDRSPEIVKEINLAINEQKKFMCFRWENLETNIIVNLGDKLFELKDQQQISFNTPEELIRRFFDSYQNYSPNVTQKNLGLRTQSSNQSMNKNSSPLVHFEITQSLKETNLKRQLPEVGFFIRSWNDYPIRVRTKAKVSLGSKPLKILKNRVGNYDGTTLWNLNPYAIAFGNFSIPDICQKSKDDLMIEVSVTIEKMDGKVFDFLPIAWKYIREKNNWLFEPNGVRQ